MGKYPTPEEAVTNFLQGVDAAVEVWAARTKAGAEKLQDYFEIVLPRVYAKVVDLPPKTGSIRTNVLRRAVPIAEEVSEAAAVYRSRKFARLRGLARTVR